MPAKTSEEGPASSSTDQGDPVARGRGAIPQCRKLDKAFDPTFQLAYIGSFLAGSIICLYGSILLGRLGPVV